MCVCVVSAFSCWAASHDSCRHSQPSARKKQIGEDKEKRKYECAKSVRVCVCARVCVCVREREAIPDGMSLTDWGSFFFAVNSSSSTLLSLSLSISLSLPHTHTHTLTLSKLIVAYFPILQHQSHQFCLTYPRGNKKIWSANNQLACIVGSIPDTSLMFIPQVLSRHSPAQKQFAQHSSECTVTPSPVWVTSPDQSHFPFFWVTSISICVRRADLVSLQGVFFFSSSFFACLVKYKLWNWLCITGPQCTMTKSPWTQNISPAPHMWSSNWLCEDCRTQAIYAALFLRKSVCVSCVQGRENSGECGSKLKRGRQEWVEIAA